MMVIAGTEHMSEATYREIAMWDENKKLELHRGCPREKPAMSVEHNDVAFELGHLLRLQLDRREYRVRVDSGRLRHSPRNFYIPDVMVIPAEVERALRQTPGTFEVYDAPMPLVVEVWSPSTGEYDIEVKLAEYQRRGDHEIWRAHPYERTITVWRRQPDGSYVETLVRSGSIEPVSLPGVTIALGELFEE